MRIRSETTHLKSVQTHEDLKNLRNAADYFQDLLFDDILPLSSVIGMDRTAGGFCESLSVGGNVPQVTRRVRVTARQIYVFAEASKLGFNFTVSRFCIQHAYNFLKDHSSDEGLIHHTITPNGTLLDEGFDLYDQAFMLLAMASAYEHLQDDLYQKEAYKLLRAITKNFKHPFGGFVDRSDKPFPMRANPHMHLFEAAMAWMAIDNDPVWRQLADEIVHLCVTYFYDPAKTALRETFNADWVAIEDQGRCRVEPGHHYEWAWLLMRWEKATGAKAGNVPYALINFAERYGYDAARHVAVNECWNDGMPHDVKARLWPQTERIKAWLAVASNSAGAEERDIAETKVLDACRGLMGYLNVEGHDSWRDIMLEDGSFAAGDAPQSTLYHLLCAFSELQAYLAKSEQVPDTLIALSIFNSVTEKGREVTQ
jgi:mannose/cellobiose epimerase-like protein (N-acyl-D-glucosamine 2-epimerase family)